MKLHQTAKTGDLQDLGIESRDSMIRYNSGEYRLWTDEYLEELLDSLPEFGPFRKYWNSIRGIQRADIGRYMFLYKHGGLYADTDVIFRKGITDYDSDKELLFASSIPILPTSGSTTTNYVIYSKAPKHPFFLDLFKEIDKRISNRQPMIFEKQVPYTTGRHVLTSVLEESTHADDVGTFPLEVITDKHCGYTRLPDTIIAYHEGSTSRKGGESWVSDSQRVFLDFECKLREAFGAEGNVCQVPVFGILLIICLAIILIIAITVPVAITQMEH